MHELETFILLSRFAVLLLVLSLASIVLIESSVPKYVWNNLLKRK